MRLEARVGIEPTHKGQNLTADNSRLNNRVQSRIQLFIQDKQASGVTNGVLRKYDRELTRFADAMARRGVVEVSDIKVDHLIAYRATWREQYPSTLTRAKVQERLRSFLIHCVDSGLIDRVPKLSPMKTAHSPTMPLSADEYSRLRSCCGSSRVRALVSCMRWTGLSITDTVRLRRSEMICTEGLWRVVTRRQKTGTHVSVPIPASVADEMLAAMKLNRCDEFVFWNTGAGTVTTAVTHWQHKLRATFRAAGMRNGHSHQLRNTFAVDLLSKGVPIEEVSKLLGHSSIKTTERSYAPWVRRRQARLDALVVAAWRKTTSSD